MLKGSCASNHSFKRVVLLGLFVGLLLLPKLSVWNSNVVHAQSGGMDDAEALRHFELALVYEIAGEWDLALEEYRIAAQAESDELAQQARDRIARILSQKRSFSNQVKSDLSKFLIGATSNLTKLLISAIMLVLFGKVFLFLTTRRTSWTVMPFLDLTKNDLGEAVSESIVSLMHKARLVHLNTSAGTLNVSEEVDLPSFGAPSYREAQFSSLKALDSLDVSMTFVRQQGNHIFESC